MKRQTALIASLALSSAALAQYQFDVFAGIAPAPLAISNNGVLAGYNSSGNIVQNTYGGAPVSIGGNSPYSGFGGSLGISGNGATAAGNATAANGFNQAAIYSVASNAWTMLGSLGYNGTGTTNGIKTQSNAFGISSDGGTVVGRSYYNTTGTTASTLHPTVFQNGAVTDLNPTGGTSQSGAALATNRDGSVVVGYTSNSSTGVIWSLSGGSYAAGGANVSYLGGTVSNVGLNLVSDSGRYVAGNSTSSTAHNYGTIFAQNTFSQATIFNRQTGVGTVIPFDHTVDFSASNTDIDRGMKAVVAGISDTGLVIGSYSVSGGGTTGILQSDAFIYNDATGLSQTFDSYLGGLGFALTATQHVYNLYAMSADGQSIAGYCFDSSTSKTSMFVLHPVQAVPEPASIAAMAVGGLAFLRKRRAKQSAR